MKNDIENQDLFVDMVNRKQRKHSCKIIQFPGIYQEEPEKFNIREFYENLPDKLWIGIILGILLMAILIMLF